MFVNPLMLWGGLAISAPIIIFLLSRFRYKTIEWAALVFLQRALKKQQRRLRVENLLLLLIRCLILLLLALALARPRAVNDVALNEDDARKNVVIVLDTSYSMGYQVGSQTAFERALLVARDVVSGLEDSDVVNVVGFDESVRLLYPQPRQLNDRVKEEILEDLDVILEDGQVSAGPPEIQLSQRGTDLPELLHALTRVLQSFDYDPSGRPPPPDAKPLPKTVFLLTDAQRLGLLDPAGLPIDRALPEKAREIKESGGALVLIDCGAEEPKNVSVTHLGALEPVVGKGLPCHIEAIVKNWSSVEIADLKVEFFVDGSQEAAKTVAMTIPAEEERSPDPLTHIFHEAGTHRIEIRVSSDGLQLDNRRELVVDVRESVRVLLVDGERSRERWESETDFIAEVLTLSEYAGEDGFGLLRPEVIRESELASQKLSEFAVVMITNVTSLDDESVATLEEFARAGGVVVFTLGANIDKQAYNDGLWRQGLGLFPAKLLGVQGGTRAEAATDEDAPEWVMTLGDSEHHVVSIFDDEELGIWLRRPSIYGFFTVDTKVPGVEAGQAPLWIPLQVISRPADDAPDTLPSADAPGQPLLIERSFGRGRAVLWLSTIDYAWNNCVLWDGFYVPFWRQLVLDLAQRSRPSLNLELGGRYERLLRAEEYAAAARVQVVTPSGVEESIELTKMDKEDLYRLVYPDDDERGGLQRSGLYTISRRNESNSADVRDDYFSVRIDPREGDLAKYSAEELGKALEIPVQPASNNGAGDVLRSKGGAAGTQEYWRELLAAVVALLALESLLAAVFGRKRR